MGVGVAGFFCAQCISKQRSTLPGPTEAIKLDLSDGAGDQRFDVLITEEEKG